MIDRLRLLAAVAMQAAPSTKTVAKRLAVSSGEAEAALADAENAHLIVSHRARRTLGHDPGGRRWRLSDDGRAEMHRLLAGSPTNAPGRI